MQKQLTSEQLEAYHRDGYIIVEDLVPPDQVENLGRRLREVYARRQTAGRNSNTS